MGLLGGKPNFALYFVGTQDDSLIFLDPHFVQDAVPSPEDLPAYESTYFTQDRSAKKIKLSGLDPGLGLGFLLRKSSDIKAFEQAFKGPLSKLAALYDKQPEALIKMSCDSDF